MKRIGLFLIIAIIAVFSFSPAFAGGKEIKVYNIETLAGTWSGYGYNRYGQLMNDLITIYIKKDGSYEAYAQMMVVGNIIVDKDNNIRYQSSYSSGTITLYEDNKGQQSLRFWRDGKLSGEYNRVK